MSTVFQDPSVQQATQSNQQTGGLDEYNPFQDGQTTKVSKIVKKDICCLIV